MHNVRIDEVLVQERIARFQRAANEQQRLRLVVGRPIPLRRRGALLVGGLLIAIGHRLVQWEKNRMREAIQSSRR